MGVPFEDQVISFIGRHRPLKVLFLGVAALGIVASAYTAVEPFAQWVKPRVLRIVGAPLSDEDKQRYGCAYFSGFAQWGLELTSKVSASLGHEAQADNLAYYQVRLIKCQAAFGFVSPLLTAQIEPTDKASLDRSMRSIGLSLSSFGGHLSTKDRLSSLLYQMANDISFLEFDLGHQRATDRLALERVPDESETNVAKRIIRMYGEAASLCPCKLPEMDLDLRSKQSLLNTVMSLDRDLELLLELEA